MIVWKDTSITDRSAGLLADPYYEWARATGFRYYGPDVVWLPVLIELLKPDDSAQAFAQDASDPHGHPWAADVRVPEFYRLPPLRLIKKKLRFLAILVKKEFLWNVYQGKAPADRIMRFDLGQAVAPGAFGKTTPVPREPDPYIGTPTVVTGVIDDGIAFAHDRLFSRDGTTRVEYLWDQLEPSDVWGEWGYGRELTKRDPVDGIDQRMKASLYSRLVDEDELYRRSGHLDRSTPGRHLPLAARASHGAHVLDLACHLPAPPAAGERPIVAVQLPVPTVADTSGATLGPHVFNALCYVLQQADAIAAAAGTALLPVVANVSYGRIAGPHDGRSCFEAALDHLIALCDPPLRVVLPAGNSRLSRCHAEFSLPAGARQSLAWRVLPDDWTESHLEIWLPVSGGKPPAVTVTVTAPDGTVASLLKPTAQQQGIVGGSVVCQASYYPANAVFYLPPGLQTALNLSQRALVRLSIAPTGAPAGDVAIVPAGLWRVELDNSAAGATPVLDIHAWIQRDDAAPGYPRHGRQSHFDDPQHCRFDDGGRAIDDDGNARTAASYVKRRFTLNAFATGDQPLVVGGFRRSDLAPYADSSGGPVLPRGRYDGVPASGPDAMLPSEDTPSHRGLLGAGTRSGSCVSMNGTSVSAPLTTRWVAEELAAGRPADRQALFDRAKAADPQPPNRPPPERGGGGRIPATVHNRRPRS